MSPSVFFFFTFRIPVTVIIVFKKSSLQQFIYRFLMLDSIATLVSRAAADSEAPTDDSQYGYVPTKYVCIIFTVLFAISTLLHAGQTIRYRMLWVIPTILLAGVLEILGWAGRLWSSFDDTLDTPYMIQIVTTIIGPTPFLAAIFVIFGGITRILGPEYSRLSPRMYSIIFVSCDVISLVVQGAGGGIAASANTPSGASDGANIMLGGICFQLVIMTVFSFLAAEYFYRFAKSLPHRAGSGARETGAPAMAMATVGRDMLIMIGGLMLSVGFLYIRAVYRTIELSGGWHGDVIETEVWFNVFDGAMVTLAFYTLNAAHPGLLLGKEAMNGTPVDKTDCLEMGSESASMSER